LVRGEVHHGLATESWFILDWFSGVLAAVFHVERTGGLQHFSRREAEYFYPCRCWLKARSAEANPLFRENSVRIIKGINSLSSNLMDSIKALAVARLRKSHPGNHNSGRFEIYKELA
jgi:hypothetical protein